MDVTPFIKTSAKLQNTHHKSACFEKKKSNKVYFSHFFPLDCLDGGRMLLSKKME